IENAIKKVLSAGYRTGDIFEEGMQKVSCSEMGDQIVSAM
ncbi:MAG: 3-isopropylmalate dehydrogenase, partial [Methylophilaceae bacterium]